MEKALVYINYPELIPLNDKSTEYDGYITIDDKFTYRIKLQVPNFPDVKNITYSGGRFHYIAIQEEDKLFKLAYYDIPKISSELLKEYASLNELFTTYCNCIEELQTYFDVMDSIDTVCWVIDPPKPKKSDYMRRIMIGHNVSIQITFDPLNILNLPQIQFMGSENGVAPFRESFINNLDNWDPEYDVVQNILRLIDLPFFPQEPTDAAKSNDLDFKVNECCICFCVQLENKLPDEICKNPNCEQCFHTDCLYQWLSAVGTSRQNFNLIQGECPNCKTCISCRIPNI
ncbi:E3 ubiquitin-protein ligase FANCL [Chrysoperla carnea]|uniref:E3 ubiquitin-protein ligase FANCL n=1 Tax=Chrysoperla carnea TaxID=189513 RepID=UPI001D072869|nr:E3 ubiquitin-protein ligase FANCL [Chrysoperla carnea]